MENLKIKSNEFRIRKMNAIEVISFRSLMDFKTLDGVSGFFKTVLENIEVKIGDEWLPVKEKNREAYYPNGIENDIKAIDKLLNYFQSYLGEVFTQSSTLKEEQE